MLEPFAGCSYLCPQCRAQAEGGGAIAQGSASPDKAKANGDGFLTARHVNPHKSVLYRADAATFLLVLSTALTELPPGATPC